jgi:hypothetical protein
MRALGSFPIAFVLAAAWNHTGIDYQIQGRHANAEAANRNAIRTVNNDRTQFTARVSRKQESVEAAEAPGPDNALTGPVLTRNHSLYEQRQERREPRRKT